MKVIAVNGSPREYGNTAHALKEALEELEVQGIEIEMIQIGNKKISGCIGCGACKKAKKCVFGDEEFTEICEKLYAADGIILGSPVYYASMNGTMKSFLDRLFFSSQGRFRHKVGFSVAVARRSGEICTFDELNKYFLITEMLIAPSNYWNSAHGNAQGEVMQDLEGISIIKNTAKNMAWLLKMKEETKETIPAPEQYARAHTSFIR